MAIEDLVKRIEEEARREASRIKEEAQASRKQVLDEANQGAESVRLSILERAKERADFERGREMTGARLDSKRALLNEKQAVMDECFRQAQDRLWSEKDEAYRKLVRKLILASVEKGDEELIFCKQDERRITPEFLKELDTELHKLGKKGKLKFTFKDGFKGGFVLKGERLEIDNTFATIVANLRPALEVELARMLF